MPPHAERSVKVFVSSTFRDMQAERDELTTRIFPRLRAFCELRGIIWREVDLRWGITDEQRLNGQVIPICLREIEACRPYFIGILGESYGWTSFDIPSEVMQQYPWLSTFRGHSITEIEFEYGALQCPKEAHRAFFYLKALGSTHWDTSSHPEEIGKTKLEKLKLRVLASGLPVYHDYSDPQSFGDQVYDDIKEAIEQDFPDQAPLHPLEADRRDHQSYALSRTRVYLQCPGLIDELNTHFKSQDQPLVILGASGSGKSALLSNWVQILHAQSPEQPIAQYYVGASARSTDWRQLVQSVLWQLGEFVEEPDSTAEGLRKAFASGLDRVANRGGAMVVIDALNQLEDREGAPDLVWLPPVLPANIRLVVSTLPGRTLDECRRRQYKELIIQELSKKERNDLVVLFLNTRYAKTLSPKQLYRVTSHPLSGNPLWLITLLEELRLYGDHDTLEEKITHYLSANSIEELYTLVLERWEEDYDRERDHFVRDSTCAIWAARRGLTESELRELLGTKDEPLPSLLWSTFLYASDHALILRSGLYGFFHDYLRQAVEQRYLATPSDHALVHNRLADFFQAKENTPRRIEELPWQFQQNQRWDALYQLLSALPFFRTAWEIDPLDVKMFWAKVEQNSKYSRLNAYQSTVDFPENHWVDASQVSTLLKESGYLEAALKIEERLIQNFDNEENWPEYAQSLTTVGQISDLLGKRKQALESHHRAEQIFREHKDDGALLVSLGEQAHIQFGMGNFQRALELFDQAEDLAQQVGDRYSLNALLLGKAEIHILMGKYQVAQEVLYQAERIGKELGDRDGLQRVYGHHANLLIHQERYSEATQLARKKETIANQLGDRVSQATALGTLSLIMQYTHQYDEAMKLNDQAKDLYEAVGYQRNVADTLSNRGAILLTLGARDNNREQIVEARQLFKDAESIYRKIEENQGLDILLNNQARAAEDVGDLEAALDLYEQSANVALTLGQYQAYASTLCNKAQLLQKLGQSDLAYETLKTALSSFEKQQNPIGASRSLRLMSMVLASNDRLQEALNAAKWAEQRAREVGSPTAIAHSLGQQAAVLEQAGQLDDALKVREEQLTHWQTSQDLNNLYLSQGKVVELAGKLGNTERILDGLRQQAKTLSLLGRLDELLEALQATISAMQEREGLDQEDQDYLNKLKALRKELQQTGSVLNE